MRHLPVYGILQFKLFQSTHPLRDATQIKRRKGVAKIFQSTHPLRDATDTDAAEFGFIGISIHAPLEGCDVVTISVSIALLGFQSTHPLRDATITFYIRFTINSRFQSTHPLRDATASGSAGNGLVDDFNPRTLAGCDAIDRGRVDRAHNFNPRTPCGMRLMRGGGSCQAIQISIHAPLAGCDKKTWSKVGGQMQFQSTHPLRDATYRTSHI